VTLTPVEELVDGGLQRDYQTRAGIRPDQCVRGVYSHDTAVHPGFSFCRDCLAWLRGETDDDPLDDGPQLAAQQTPPEMWRGYVEMLRDGGTTI
jgi:hypothetical protein